MKVAITERIEQEVVYLLAVIDLIRSMVNKELLEVVGKPGDQSICFKSMVHKRFFSIALVDFLSLTDAKAPVPKTSYLSALREISSSPCFEANGSAQKLKHAVNAFIDWLNVEMSMDIWLGSINVEVKNLRISRLLLFKIGGNLSKHNFLRAVGVAEDLQKLLARAGVEVELHDAILAQEEVYDTFHGDVGAYHDSTVAEFLNELAWGIQAYLLPEFQRSIVYEGGDSLRYWYQPPGDLKHPFSKTCYWNLMNQVRTGPIVKPFTVTCHLKGRY
ncbi:hypothetical protein [Pseudomonas rubra]|uniref:Uncharacterized protein n=1 Tax=Pseudomonas rubra TaxID=2942627 RepID=A0ABT5PEV5_9PSED|nr:hypothetical protein [Pseudomonas rubra]MDD1016843.1 hypothetical protein [Pseudomonas rubra]MDD1041482.1 hypothetical protein [Pseudomonas rubra]MDD1154987.1 hypothetical protein [Pseudomonas rubra]